MADLTVNIIQAEGFPVIALSGELDAYHAPRLRDQLESLIQPGSATVIVDLLRVTYVDSTGLGILVAARKRADGHSGALRLVVNREGAVHRTLTITGLLTVFPIFPDEVTAQATLAPIGKDT